MSSQVANFASGIGVYDSTLYNNPVLDTSANVGSGDLSLNATQQQYMMSNTNFTTLAGTGNGISFSGWFYPVGNQSIGSTIFDISGIGASVALFYGTTGTNTGTLTGAFNGIDVSSSISVNAGQWHFFTYTIYCTSLSTAYQTLYIDNSMNSSTSYPATQNSSPYVAFSAGASTPNTGSYIGYGKGNTGANPAYSYFNGRIDDFRFYNRVLSPPEVNVLYNFNYKSGAIPAITSQMNYDISYVNAVQIDVSGIFSGLYVTRTAQVGSVTSVTSTTVSCANLVFVNATTWAYVDTTVAADTSYSYTVQPYVMNTSGNLVQFGSVTTTPIYNGFFNQGVALPASGTYINANTANVPGWTFTSGTNINLCNGSVPTVFTGVLPSTVTYYIDISQNVAQSTSLSQYVGIYQGTSGYVSFYAWPKDLSYNGTESISVSLGGITLLNQYTFTPYVLSATPYTAFNLPFSMVVAGTYLLTITVTNPSTNLSGINFGGVQIRSLSTVGIGYKHVDPSGLALYYPLDTETVSGTVVYDCSAGFSGLASTADASLCGGAVLDTYKNIMGTADVSLNGTTGYVQLGNWTCPGAQVGNGFSVGGWFHPTLAVEPSNATLCLFQNSGTNSVFSVFLNQQTMWMDFSYNFNGLAGQTEYVANSVTLLVNGWNYFTVTGSCSTSGSMNLNYYLNDVSLASLTGAWPTGVTLFNSNSLGGVPPTTVVNMNRAGNLGYFRGYMEDFRVYNRALSQQDIFALWSYGFSTKSYSNLIDPLSLGMYYPMEQGSTLMKAPPSPITGFTPSVITSTGFTLTWTGGAGVVNSYSYAVTPSGGTRTVVTPTGSAPTVVFSGLTAPSSAPYAWTVDVSLTNVAGTTVGTTTVYAPPTALVLSSAYSAGNVTLTWTGGLGNAVTVTYSTTGAASPQSGTITSPAVISVTAGGGPWTFDVSATNASGFVTASTTAAQNPFTINSITTTNGSYTTDQKSSLSGSLSTGNGIVGGTSTTNGVTYTCYAFGQTSTWGTYTLTYTGGNSYMYVLAVGGGGGGGGYSAGGGGGAGGVVMMPVYITGSGTISVSVGAGAAGTLAVGGNGSPTTVTFSSNASANINALGGGGGNHDALVGLAGGSSGGNGYYATASVTSVPPLPGSFNYGNTGGGASSTGGPGGGGAGTAGTIGNSSGGSTGGSGGNGIQCFLPGIKDFAPSGTAYGTYYWGGGGGGSSSSSGSGRGGLGGGGGGGQSSAQAGGTGGSGINYGGNGINNNGNGGNGGANTGGGGGGHWQATLSGSGGSGIVVIAFPQNVITSNQSAVLPSTLITNYNAVLNNASLTTGAYNSIKGAFACKLLNYNYFGPVMTLRHSLDTTGVYTVNFYADVCGNMGTGYLGTGLSVYNWLSLNGANTNYAYVTKWYNQGMDASFNSATQYTLGSQPVYEVATGIMNFGYVGIAPQNGFFNLPNGALPLSPNGTTDCSTAYVFRNGNYSGSSTMSIISGGVNTNYNATGIIMNYDAAGKYSYWGSSDDYSSTTSMMAANNVVTMNSVSTGTTSFATLSLYVNGTYNAGKPSSGIHQQSPLNNFIANNTANSGLSSSRTFQLYNLLYFGYNALTSGTDRAIIEATPYLYTAPGTITGLTTSSVTATTLVLSWNSFSANATYALWINGAFYANYGIGILTTGTVTPGVSGPWTLNLYAYNTTVGLLASGWTFASYYYTGVGVPSFCLIGSSSTVPTRDTTNNYAVSSSGMTMTIDPTNKRGYCFNYKPAVLSTASSIIYVSYSVKSSLTVAFWIRSSSPGLYPNNVTGAGSTQLFVQVGSNIVSVLGPGFSGVAQVSGPYKEALWMHIAYTYNGSNVIIYIDGIQYTGTTTGGAFPMNTTQPFYFGDVGIGSGNGYCGNSGQFNNIYMWDTVLTPAQIISVYNNT